MAKKILKQILSVALILSLVTYSNVNLNVFADDTIANGECGDLVWNISADKVLTISGEGEYDEMFMEWMFYVDDVEHVIIDVEGITVVDRMLSGMEKVKTVDLSELNAANITSGVDFFEGCTAIESIKTPINLSVDISLPDADWKDANNTSYTVLPKNQNTSVNLFLKVIEVRGFQYNCNTNGFRIISIVNREIFGLNVVENGIIMGVQSKGVQNSELVIDSTNMFVKSFAATEIGNTSWKFGNLNNADYYTMTMEGIPLTKQWLETKFLVRAYAKLSDGRYVYSDVTVTSVYSVAKILYDKVKMESKEKHNYLHTNILSICTPGYPEVDYDWGPIVSI